jgi:trk system potassium uptake protein TrkH
VFEVTSAITTTGCFTVDYGQWPPVALMALALLLAVIAFVLIYIAVFVFGTAALALDASVDGRPRQDALDLIFASASTLANAGVGLGSAGTRGSFAAFGDPSKVTMTLLMWVGRLEILPVVVLLRRSCWRR